MRVSTDRRASCCVDATLARAIAQRVLAALRAASRRSRVDRRQRARAAARRRRGRSARSCGATAAARGVRVHVAIAGTQTAALVLAHARPGSRSSTPGERSRGARAAADRRSSKQRRRPLQRIDARRAGRATREPRASCGCDVSSVGGFKTLGELAALPAGRSGRAARAARRWRGRRSRAARIVRPLVPDARRGALRASLELEWPIEGLEPLSFVLTRLLEPLSTRLERRDRGAAVLHVVLAAGHAETPCTRGAAAAVADARRAHAADAGAARSRVASARRRPSIASRSSIDPTPGRVLQHTLFTRAHPTPEQLSTLLARLGALMGQDRIGAPAHGRFVSSRRVRDEAVCDRARRSTQRSRSTQTNTFVTQDRDLRTPRALRARLSSSLRCAAAVSRCPRACAVDRRPPGARHDRSPRLAGGARACACAGPWRTSGEWWAGVEQDRRPSQRPGTAGIATSGTWRSSDGATYRDLPRSRHATRGSSRRSSIESITTEARMTLRITRCPDRFRPLCPLSSVVERVCRRTSSSTPPPPSAFCKARRCPKRSSSAPRRSATPPLALLDRDGVYGAPRFHKAALAAGIRPIIGAELTIERQKSEVRSQK